MSPASGGSFLAAGAAFADLVGRLPDDLSGPGLGDWDLRALVGHTSRSLVTVSTYLAAPAPEAVALESATAYVAMLAEAANGDPGVVERGRAAGEALGDDPALIVQRLLAEVERGLAAADPDRLVTTIGGGMRLADYLPTRTFELVVHGFDIGRATGLDWQPPAAALAEAVRLTADVSLHRGEAAAFLLAVTGRATEPYSAI